MHAEAPGTRVYKNSIQANTIEGKTEGTYKGFKRITSTRLRPLCAGFSTVPESARREYRPYYSDTRHNSL